MANFLAPVVSILIPVWIWLCIRILANEEESFSLKLPKNKDSN